MKKKNYLAILYLFFSFAIQAQTFQTWRDDSGTGDNSWQNAINWWNFPNASPIVFGQQEWDNDHLPAQVNSADISTWRFLFKSGASAVHTFTGNQVSFFDYSNADPQILNQSGATHIINNNLIGDADAADPLSLLVEGTGGLTFGGAITNRGWINVSGTTASATTVTINGVISGAGGVTKENANISLLYKNDNTYSGATNLNTGTLILEGSLANSAVSIGANGTLQISENATLLSLTVAAGGVVILDAGKSLSVTNNLVNNGTSFTMNSGSSLLVGGTSTGNITYTRSISKDADLTKAWYLVASPVAGETIGNLISNHNFASGTGANIGLAPYENTQVDVNDRWNYQSTGSTGTVNSGQGYSVKLDNGSVGSTISFTGTINTANITPSIVDGNTVNTGGSPYNLIGNPYTAFINSGLFLTANTTILESETIWLWNQATDSYDTKVTADTFKVAPTQSFFVERKASGVATDFTFDVTNQNHETTDTFQRDSRSEIQLFISNNTDSRYAKIYYINGTTAGFDNGYDGELFSGLPTNFSLYTQLISGNVGKNYQIQSLPATNFETMVLPIGLKAAAGDITFTADAMNLPANYKVFLEDRIADTFTRLDEVGQKYQVTLATASEGIGRFYLHTAESVLTVNNEALESVSIYKYDKTTIRITGLQQGKTTISLFNILGKQVVNTSFEANGVQDISLPKLASGIYVLQLKTTTGKLNKRIVLE